MPAKLGALLLAGLVGHAAAASECRDMLILPADMVGFTGMGVVHTTHYRDAGGNMTWDNANAACIKEGHGKKLCTLKDMCSGGKPTVAAPKGGVVWAPVGDSPNSWADIGSDPNVCKKFEEVNGFKPEWGMDATQTQENRGLFRCCGSEGVEAPPPAVDGSVAPASVHKQFPCECTMMPDALSQAEEEGLANAADPEAYLRDINPAVNCVCMDKTMPLCMKDPKVVAKEMKAAYWDPAVANIPEAKPITSFNDPNTPTTEGLQLYTDPKREGMRKMKELTLEEEMELLSGLADLKAGMDKSREERIVHSKRIKKLQAQLAKQDATNIPIEDLLKKPESEGPKISVLVTKPKPVQKISTADVVDSHGNLAEFKAAMDDFGADVEAAKAEDSA